MFNRPDDRKFGTVEAIASYIDLKTVDGNVWPVSTGETGEIVSGQRDHIRWAPYYENPMAT